MDKSIFEVKMKYNGNEVTVNAVLDSAFIETAAEAKSLISSLIAYYGAIFAYQLKILSSRKRERAELYSSCRNTVEIDLIDKKYKVTEAAIQGGIDTHPDWRKKSIEIEEVEFNVKYLEQAIWALKTKADNVRESLKPESYNQ